ncbi:hypothetical protein [Staphylococcus phage vB_SauM-V1SA09]|uniref:Uncharacterized protein n=1 Tax=Staphylococcus phage qdsa002 TaxID=1970746 RepID=A0A1X9SIR7_9CAUD|nr:hypothetical protein qdsa002_18 [Staphylococcus phage qdsa002]WDQ44021.1 hypothetical protein ESA2_CDS24 [Staphylococcus phage ESa2]WOZ17330.1 hypothetical protein [Staphylococcus phage vB_SauM-V1SA09]
MLTNFQIHDNIKIVRKTKKRKGIDNYEQIRNSKRYGNGIYPYDG